MKKYDKCINYIFVILIVGSLCIIPLFVLFIQNQKDVSKTENRELVTNASLNDKSFGDKSFQDTFETLLSDQFIYRSEFVGLKNTLDLFSTRIQNNGNNNTTLTQIGATGVYQIGKSDYLMNYPITDYSKEDEDKIINRINQINELAAKIPNTNFYIFRPYQAHEYSFFDEANNIKSYGAYYNSLFDLYSKVPVGYFRANNLDEYKEYYYATDHHWNYKGAYQGYLGILELVGKENEALPVSETVCGDNLTFYGSFANRTGNVTNGDNFCVYTFDSMPSFSISSYGTPEEDVHNPNYFAEHINEYTSDSFHYSSAYYDYTPFSQYVNLSAGSKGKALFVVDSYGAFVASNLASNYNVTYFLNPSEYYQEYGEPFNYYEFIDVNDVETVVFMYTLDNYYVEVDGYANYAYYDINYGGND